MRSLIRPAAMKIGIAHMMAYVPTHLLVPATGNKSRYQDNARIAWFFQPSHIGYIHSSRLNS